MALNNFIKENFVLVVGLTLPLLLVVLFFVASVLPKAFSTPPQYELIFTANHYDYQNHSPVNINFVVRDGQVMARVTKDSHQHAHHNYQLKKLMVYDGKTQSTREVPYNTAELKTLPDGSEVPLEELKGMKVDSSTRAPDGYEFNVPGYRSRGFANEIFWGGGGYGRYAARVTKGMVSYKVPLHGQNYYSHDQGSFVGWIIEKK